MTNSWCDSVHLPSSYRWGEWRGDYRCVERKDGTPVCGVGGLAAKVNPDMHSETIRAIIKGEVEIRKTELLLEINEEMARIYEGVRE